MTEREFQIQLAFMGVTFTEVVLTDDSVKAMIEKGGWLEFSDRGVFVKDEDGNVLLESTPDQPLWHKPKEEP